MSQLKKLIREIDRRSLWQVLLLYVAASWAVLAGVDTLAGALGLPEWAPPLALFLLIVGLPIVLATAFVQEGMGTREKAASTETETTTEAAGTTDESPAPGKRDRSVRHRLFTWRNAILGGLCAFALLGIATAGYLASRTLGIGPAATLVAQGVFEEGGQVLLTDFKGTDPELADVVTGSLRIDLLQSPTIKLVEQSNVSDALRRMERDPNDPVTSDMAQELAFRGGYQAAIEGEIGTAGSGYVLTARIMDGEDWATLAAFRETASGEDDLIAAIESLSRSIRDKAGESLRSVRASPRLERVTTSSLPAFRAYTRGQALTDAGDLPGSLELYERAVELDPEFAMAYRKIGVQLGNMGIRRADEVNAVTRAYELGDRLPEDERFLAEAYYHGEVTGDWTATMRAYEGLIEIDPDNGAALNNLANYYRALDRLEEAESLYLRALAVAPYPGGFANLSWNRYLQGDIEGALAALDSGTARHPDAAWNFEGWRVHLVISSADYETTDSLAEVYASRFTEPEPRSRVAEDRLILAAIHGRLRDAEREIAGDMSLSRRLRANLMLQANIRAELALVRGDDTEAASILRAAHDEHRDALSPGDRRYHETIISLVAAGAVADANRLFDEWATEEPDSLLGIIQQGERNRATAWLTSTTDPEEAIRLWNEYARRCPSWWDYLATLGMAHAHERLGDAEAATAEYARFLASRNPLRLFEDDTHRAATYERLGQLYDEQGDLENAAKYYAMFVELWADADPELQPRVRAAQARLEEIVAERG